MPRNFSGGANKVAASRVLIVDDEPLVRWAIAETLTDRGFDVSEAGDAESAKRTILAAHPPDLAVLDLHLPDSEDLALAFFLRTHAPDTSLVLMTAFGTPDILAQAATFGIPILTKPFDMDELSGLVDRTLAMRDL